MSEPTPNRPLTVVFPKATDVADGAAMKKDDNTRPPHNVRFPGNGYAGYTSSAPQSAAPKAAAQPQTHRTDNCRFRPAGC